MDWVQAQAGKRRYWGFDDDEEVSMDVKER